MTCRATAVATVAMVALAACTSGSAPAPEATTPTTPATVPAPPSAAAAKSAPGAAALGDDPTTSEAGVPVNEVDWMTPAPQDVTAEKDSPASCHQGKESAEVVQCVLGDPDGDVTVAVAGDSKTRQWVPALDVAAKDLGWKLLVSTKTTCAFTTAATANGGARSPYPSCDEWNKALIDKITSQKPDIFINALYKMRGLATSDTETREQTRELMIEGVSDAVGQIAAAGADVILLNSTPMLSVDVPECIEEHASALRKCSSPREQAFAPDKTWDAASSDRVLAAAPGSQLIDLNDYICPAERCAPVIGNIIVYRDKHHITTPYMRTLAPMLEKELVAAAATF